MTPEQLFKQELYALIQKHDVKFRSTGEPLSYYMEIGECPLFMWEIARDNPKRTVFTCAL